MLVALLVFLSNKSATPVSECRNPSECFFFARVVAKLNDVRQCFEQGGLFLIFPDVRSSLEVFGLKSSQDLHVPKTSLFVLEKILLGFPLRAFKAICWKYTDSQARVTTCMAG